MGSYAGLDVAQQATQVCVVDGDGVVRFEGRCGTDPEVIAGLLGREAPDAVRVVVETGALTPWLVHGLEAKGVPVVCTCARQAHAALSHGPNKTDRADALGLARLAQTGWMKTVTVRSPASHEQKSQIVARATLIRLRTQFSNQIRGLLKPLGLILGKVPRGRFEQRVRELAQDRPELMAALEPLLTLRRQAIEELRKLDDHLLARAKSDTVVRRLMTIPGIGATTALTVKAVIDDPGRFRKSPEVGAYLGLVPRRWQSGKVDQTGRITRCGDRMLRQLLFEAANVVLFLVKKPTALKRWGEELATRAGAKKAKVALARRLAVLMHRLWVKGEAFDAARGMPA